MPYNGIRTPRRGVADGGHRDNVMIRPWLFLALVLCGIAGVAALLKPAPEDAFSALGENQVVYLSGLGFSGVYAAKRAHGLAAAPYRFGLFGNSRSLNLGAVDLGLASGSYFNFSVIGGSFRASLLLLEQLAEAGRAPRIAIISVDHLELQEDNNPAIAGVGPRLALAMDDIATGLADPRIGETELARMTWRHVYGAVRDIGRLLNFRRLMLGVRWRADQLLGQSDSADDRLEPGYRRDGSIVLPDNLTQVPSRVSAPQPALYILGYLDADLDRVAALERQGIRIVLYESLLDRVNAEHVARHPNPHAVAARQRWLAGCRRLGLTCHPFDPAAVPEVSGIWADASHPPAALLGRYVGALAAVD